jgi:hypothetical protein
VCSAPGAVESETSPHTQADRGVEDWFPVVGTPSSDAQPTRPPRSRYVAPRLPRRPSVRAAEQKDPILLEAYAGFVVARESDQESRPTQGLRFIQTAGFLLAELKVQYRETRVRYVACAVTAPDGPLETANNVVLRGKTMSDLWHEF